MQLNYAKNEVLGHKRKEDVKSTLLGHLPVYHFIGKNEKAVTLVDTSILRFCNSTSLTLLLTKVLTDFERDVIGLASDLAEYMLKLLGDLRSTNNPKLLHIA